MPAFVSFIKKSDMKKNTFYWLLLILPFLFVGCLETTEELTLAENGSGTYRYVLDLKGLFEMLENMKSMDTSAHADMGFPKERKDTTINLRDFADTAATLTAEQKALYRNATVNLLMDEKQKQFNITMNLPFDKPDDATKMARLLSSDESGGMLSKLFEKNKVMGNEGGSSNGKMPDLNSFFDMAVAKGSIERKLNKVKYDSVMQVYGSQFSAEGMGDMLESVKMNTIVHLPRAAKKITGSKVVASADKKTITLNGNLADLFKNPQVFSYRVEY